MEGEELPRVIDRPKEQKPFEEDDDEFGDAFPDERPTSPGQVRAATDKPTVAPPFDFNEFAKTSDSRLRTAATPATPAPPSTAMTKPPPRPLDSLLEFDDVEPDTDSDAPRPLPMRPPQVTLTNEDELESARLRSVLMPSEPPVPESALELVDERNTSVIPGAVRARGVTRDYEEGDPFGSSSSSATPPDDDMPTQMPAATDALSDMRDRYSVGDYSGALEVAEAWLARHPGDPEVTRYAERCRQTLLQMYSARVGPMDRIPVVMVPREQLRWLSIDHRAGFLLSHIDGVSSLEMILDVSGMPALDALRILYELSQQRVISFR